MKKKVVTLLLCISCAATLLAGCGSSNSASGNVTLAEEDYKGIEVAAVEPEEVTDDDVQDAIDSVLEENAETTEVADRAVKDGDTVNIDYVGTVDGEEFDGGSYEGYDLEIGSDSFIDGFEDQIIGHETGDEFDINVTFPDDYSSDDLAGKDAVFAITLNSISKVTTPELTDEFVATVSDTSTTVDEYKEELRAQLEEDNQTTADETFAENVMQAVLDNAEVDEYDADELETLVTESKSYYEQIISSFYGTTLSDYLEQVGETEEDFDAEIEEECKNTLKEQMVCAYIAEKEGLELTDDEYQEKLEEMVSDYGYSSTDEVIEEYASYYASDDDSDSDSDDSSTEVSDEAKEKAEEELKKSFLQDKVSDWLVENCTKTEAASDTEDADTTEDTTTEDADE